MSRTFVRIIVLISLLLSSILLGFSFATFMSFEGIVTERAYKENIKELRIIGDSIKSMHESVKSFTFRQIDDTSLLPLFEKDILEYAEMYSYMREIKESFEINPIFHSVSLYSGSSGNYYSTLSSKAQRDTFFVDSIKNYKEMQALTPMPRVLPYEAYNNDDTVFTYLYFQTDSSNKVTKAMAVNMDAAWLCDNLSRLKGKLVKAYIIDKKSRTYIDESRKIRELDALDPALIEKIMQPNLDIGSFEIGKNEDQRIYTYLWMPDTNWVLVVEEPNTFLNQSLQIVRKVVVQITFGFGILAFAAVFFISHRIYRPFGKLFKEVMGPSKKSDTKVKLLDDVKLLTEVFHMNKKMLNDYSSYKNSADIILLENYIKAVLLENNSMANQLTGEFSSAFGDILEKETMLILLKIDGLEQFEMLDASTKKAYRFSIMNVSEEVFDIGYTAKTIYIGEGLFILLVFLPEITGKEKKNILWEDKIRFLQKTIRELMGISLSVFIGGYAQGPEALVHAYNAACTLLKYGIVYSQESILDASILDIHENNHVVYDESLEEKILDLIRAGNVEEAKASFDKLVELSSRGDIESFMLSMTRFSLALGRNIEILNKSRIEKIPISVKDFYIRLASFESIDVLKNQFYEVIERITEKKALVETRHDALVESIKKYAHDNYFMDLSLKGIAAEFKLSQGYLGTIFKESVGVSVMDYINNIRLDKSELLLLKTELSVAEIMEKTGFLNESSFYKLFKRKFGATPKAYRVDKGIINKSKKR